MELKKIKKKIMGGVKLTLLNNKQTSTIRNEIIFYRILFYILLFYYIIEYIYYINIINSKLRIKFLEKLE